VIVTNRSGLHTYKIDSSTGETSAVFAQVSVVSVSTEANRSKQLKSALTGSPWKSFRSLLYSKSRFACQIVLALCDCDASERTLGSLDALGETCAGKTSSPETCEVEALFFKSCRLQAILGRGGVAACSVAISLGRREHTDTGSVCFVARFGDKVLCVLAKALLVQWCWYGSVAGYRIPLDTDTP
jgi:hypothetical protein